MIKNPVTPEDADKFEAYIIKWQDKLNLKDWRIERSPKPSKHMAEVSRRLVEDRIATYRIGKHFGECKVTEYSLESTAVHELIHILLSELISVAETKDHTQESLMSAEHRVVNTIERLLVPEPSQP